MSIEPNANQTHSVQFFERTLDDSANRRLVIPESFLATDAILILMSNVALGLQVNRNRISQRVRSELPFMATERLIVRAVNKGVDRQDAHEIVRRHSMEVTASMRAGAEANDLLERLGDDSGLKLSKAELDDAADPNAFVGRAPQQVDEFLSEIVEPLLAGHETTTSGELRV
jgi:adenylosuccinate lyase